MSDARVAFPASLNERYKNPRFIGSGGASTVFAAHDVNLNKRVAIKIMGPRPSNQKLLRFQQEAKVISRIAHPNIVTAIDFGIVDENYAYMVMDLVGEDTLLGLIESDEDLSIRKCVDIFKQICQAMAHAHSQGVLHRDLKPSNVLLDNPGSDSPRAKVADFGVAKIAGTPFLVTTGSIFIGTPCYMSPEQFRAEEVDQRSDIYSFGCLMFETLTGSVPFSGEVSTELALKHATEPVPEMTCTASGEDIPELLQVVVQGCLEKDPADRYESFAQVEELLNTVTVMEESARAAEIRSSHSAKEPYLVSAGNSHFRFSDNLASKQVVALIVGLVVFVGGGICLSLLGWAPGGWLFPDAKTPQETSTRESVNDVQLPAETEQARNIVMVGTSQNPQGDTQKAWKVRKRTPMKLLEGKSDYLLEMARKQMQRNRHRSAVEFLDVVLEREPRNVKALKLRSDALRALHEYASALTDITTAILISPKDKKLIFKRAVLNKENNDLNGALDDFSLLIEDFKDNPRYHLERGEIYEMLGRNKDAIEDFSTSIELGPTEQAYRGRAKMYQREGNPKSAISDLSVAIEMNPQSAELYFLRGNSYSGLKQYKQAISDYSSAIEMKRGKPMYYTARAIAYEKIGQTASAQADRRSAEQVNLENK